MLALTRSNKGQGLCGGPGSLPHPCIGTHSKGHIGQGDRQIDWQLGVQSSVHNKLSTEEKRKSESSRCNLFIDRMNKAKQLAWCLYLLSVGGAVLHHVAPQFSIQLSWGPLPCQQHVCPVQHSANVNGRVIWHWKKTKRVYIFKLLYRFWVVSQIG